jgi:hypothetical protein
VHERLEVSDGSGKEFPSSTTVTPGFPQEGGLAHRLLYPRAMELEHAIATEVKRLAVVADAAAREIAANRPWWVAAVLFLRKVVL